jgi:ribosomal protein S18 acetylase RimI-like enzyme
VARAPDARIVGFISVGPSRDEDAPTPDELYAINLLSEVHGTGLAQELLDQGLGDRDATLWMAEDNPRARRFYVRNGFVPEGARKEHPRSGVPEIRMVRRREPQRGVTAS